MKCVGERVFVRSVLDTTATANVLLLPSKRRRQPRCGHRILDGSSSPLSQGPSTKIVPAHTPGQRRVRALKIPPGPTQSHSHRLIEARLDGRQPLVFVPCLVFRCSGHFHLESFDSSVFRPVGFVVTSAANHRGLHAPSPGAPTHSRRHSLRSHQRTTVRLTFGGMASDLAS